MHIHLSNTSGRMPYVGIEFTEFRPPVIVIDRMGGDTIHEYLQSMPIRLSHTGARS